MASDQFKEAQSAIDSIFEQLGTRESLPANERILALAKRGVDAPEVLSHKELQQVCYALVMHYAQMGIC